MVHCKCDALYLQKVYLLISIRLHWMPQRQRELQRQLPYRKACDVKLVLFHYVFQVLVLRNLVLELMLLQYSNCGTCRRQCQVRNNTIKLLLYIIIPVLNIFFRTMMLKIRCQFILTAISDFFSFAKDAGRESFGF